jgi:hypothetical protein
MMKWKLDLDGSVMAGSHRIKKFFNMVYTNALTGFIIVKVYNLTIIVNMRSAYIFLDTSSNVLQGKNNL